jgi:hypothetical protein
MAVNCSKSSVVGYSTDDNDVSTESEESPLLRSVTGKRLIKADCEGSVCAVVICKVWRIAIALGRAVAQRLDTGFPPRRSGFAYGQHVGFVVDKAALGQVFYEYFGFPCQSFYRFLHYHNHPRLTQ